MDGEKSLNDGCNGDQRALVLRDITAIAAGRHYLDISLLLHLLRAIYKVASCHLRVNGPALQETPGGDGRSAMPASDEGDVSGGWRRLAGSESGRRLKGRLRTNNELREPLGRQREEAILARKQAVGCGREIVG